MPDTFTAILPESSDKNLPQRIFVDLDGTLVRTDLFVESLLKLIKKNPLYIFKLVWWAIQGRSVMKVRVARLIRPDVPLLPYENALVDYLRQQKAVGRHLVLATASHWTYAKRVAAYVGLFDSVIATTRKNNLKGRRKLAKIRKSVGNAEFTYAGDSGADRPIWNEAASAILVNARSSDVEEMAARGKCERIIKTRGPIFGAFVREMRLHQWTKNGLVFVPLLTAHGYQDMESLLRTVLAFIIFGLCASGVYFLNDLLDLDADRHHPRKRTRPLASGDLPIHLGVLGTMALPLVSFLLAGFFLPLAFVGVLGAYYFLTNFYSFYLKRVSTADVMTLAVLYTLRVVAGAAATGITLSSWLMAFSVFVFVSLAYLKRYIEVAELDRDAGSAKGRGYDAADSETMFGLGIANSTAAVLVLALYINSNEVAALYQTPQLLWLLCFLLLYWTNRIWVGARRRKIADDPVVFAIKDKVSRMVGVAFVAVVLLARYVTIQAVI